jgi:hypothetical protein
MIETWSKFYYGFTIDETNRYVDFDEGGAELTAELPIGSYALSEMATLIKDAMDAAGALTYTVTLARSTRVFTIAAGSNFTLRVASGSHSGQTAFTLLGFTGANRTGDDSYAGNAGAGYSYAPQYLLQSYVDPEHYQEAVSASVNESANGDVEVVKFGTRQFIQMNLCYITDRTMPTGGPITNNASGVANAVSFLEYIVTKAPFEFIPDVDDADTYHKVILESTQASKDGVGFILNELYDRNMPGFYETGILKLRVVS